MSGNLVHWSSLVLGYGEPGDQDWAQDNHGLQPYVQAHLDYILMAWLFAHLSHAHLEFRLSDD